MKFTVATIAGFVALSAAVPGGVTRALSPMGTPICAPNFSGTFQIGVVKASAPRAKLSKRQSGALILTLKSGILKDSEGRTGYIASNRQFQFDDPPQAGAIWTAGFSVCGNDTLALASAVFFECLSGDFFNLYDRPSQSDCSPIFLDVIPSSGAGKVTQIGDGQPQAPTAVPTTVSQIKDGQIEAPTTTGVTAAKVTQIGDGQPQAPVSSKVIVATSTLIPPPKTSQVQPPKNTTFPTPPHFGGAARPSAISGQSIFGLVLAAGFALAGGILS